MRRAPFLPAGVFLLDWSSKSTGLRGTASRPPPPRTHAPRAHLPTGAGEKDETLPAHQGEGLWQRRNLRVDFLHLALTSDTPAPDCSQILG